MNGRSLAVLALVAIAACSTTSETTNPTLRADGSEAPVAVTVATGAEHVPAWDRQPGRATLLVPADLLFAVDSAEPGPGSDAILDPVVSEVRSHPGAKVLVEGFADSDGRADHNQELSERRADAVARWLETRGISPSTITRRGWGEVRPAVAETDEAAKARNRRVVITITF